MVGWQYRLNEHEFEQAPGAGDGQGSLACYIDIWQTQYNIVKLKNKKLKKILKSGTKLSVWTELN